MGCGSSKNKVHVGSPAPGDNGRTVSAGKAKPKKIEVKAKKEGDKKSSRPNSSASLRSERDDERTESGRREVSAVSRDSGYADAEYANVITEESDPAKVAEVERAFKEKQNLDLSLVGVGRGGSAKLGRIDEKAILDSLAADGLISRPVFASNSRSYSFLVSFDGPAEGGEEQLQLTPRSRPARLQKLEKLERRRKKKPKSEMTEEEIKAKLERAQQRRKERERQKLERIQAITNASGETVVTLENQQTEQTEKVQEELQSKMAAVSENREKRTSAMREKLRAAKEHAEEVRRRKKLQQGQQQQLDEDGNVVPDDGRVTKMSLVRRSPISGADGDDEFIVPSMKTDFKYDNDDDAGNESRNNTTQSNFFDEFDGRQTSATRSRRANLALDLPDAD